MQMSPLKSQMALACFTQHCLTKPFLNQPRSCRVEETTAFLLSSSSSHFFLFRSDVHTSRNSENWTAFSFYLVSASANHCKNAHSYIYPQQRHLPWSSKQVDQHPPGEQQWCPSQIPKSVTAKSVLEMVSLKTPSDPPILHWSWDHSHAALQLDPRCGMHPLPPLIPKPSLGACTRQCGLGMVECCVKWE